MTTEQIKHLEYLRKRAQRLIRNINMYASLAGYVTGERDVTPDYIWGEATLAELKATLDGRKAGKK